MESTNNLLVDTSMKNLRFANMETSFIKLGFFVCDWCPRGAEGRPIGGAIVGPTEAERGPIGRAISEKH